LRCEWLGRASSGRSHHPPRPNNRGTLEKKRRRRRRRRRRRGKKEEEEEKKESGGRRGKGKIRGKIEKRSCEGRRKDFSTLRTKELANSARSLISCKLSDVGITAP